MAQIIFKDVTLSFDNNVIVESFDLSIKKGEIITFFGPSGCGKSSIMKLILGINTPTKGYVKIAGLDAEKYQLPISYVPQDNELLPWLSVKENIEIWSKNAKEPGLSSTEILELVELSSHSQKFPNTLSGGMSRRTALARGLATQSEILCFDEAMVGIEKTIRHKLLYNLRKHIKEKNSTAIFISHDYEETIFLSDRIIVFSPPPSTILKIIDLQGISGKFERELVVNYQIDINKIELYNIVDRELIFFNSNIFKEAYNQLMI